jgi:catechol 2,3-dioxygenase-like lactoylglutathione lyase family enzyme
VLSRRSTWWGVVVAPPDPLALAEFYAALLGWPIHDRDDTWVTIAVPGTTSYLGFHASPEYRPPTWPPAPGAQQQMLHLDLEVEDLAVAVAEAEAVGARQAAVQPQPDVRVMLDPVGHPFCLYVGSEETPAAEVVAAEAVAADELAVDPAAPEG